jgi:hypothetical protein
MEGCIFYVFGYLFYLSQLIGNCRVSVEIKRSILTLVNFKGQLSLPFQRKRNFMLYVGILFVGILCTTKSRNMSPRNIQLNITKYNCY